MILTSPVFPLSPQPNSICLSVPEGSATMQGTVKDVKEEQSF